MHSIQLLSIGEQTIQHLRQGIQEGRWSGRLPGVVRLAAECDVSTGVIRTALRKLESEGIISSRGLGRCRTIISTEKSITPLAAQRVGILLHDTIRNASLLVWKITRNLELAGHVVTFAEKSQIELNFNLPQIIRIVANTPVDAWIVIAGSHELLEWFSTQEIPCLAVCGRGSGISLARTAPDKLPAMLDAMRQIIALGHRRIVIIGRAGRRKPAPAMHERHLLEEMQAHGIATGPYNFPDWEETPAGFNNLLENLFRTTPPTALFLDEPQYLVAAMQFLARHHIDIPTQVSLVFTCFDSALDLCHPSIACMEWDVSLLIRRVTRWVTAVRKGNPDRKVINVPVTFRPGGSIGPVAQGRR